MLLLPNRCQDRKGSFMVETTKWESSDTLLSYQQQQQQQQQQQIDGQTRT